MTLSPEVDKHVDNSLLGPFWEPLKTKLRDKVNPINYNNWLKPIREVRLDNDQVVIVVPNKFTIDWITDYYIKLIEDEAATFLGRPVKVRFEISEGGENGGDEEAPSEPALPIAPPLADLLPSFRTPKVGITNPLNPKYTFEAFVAGSGNQLAHAAAKSVSELPGGHYNPLFLYGGVGLGKTHLLNSVGLEVLRRHPAARIIYISSEKFMNEFIHSIRHDKMIDFRKKYRESCDLLLIDDIQFLGGRESTQDEFFHTFNALHDSQRQIIITSDKIPKEIPGLEERLRSRFEWGLIADIQPPDFETRVAILRKKAEKDNIPLHDDVAMYLAKEVKSNVRELEGALIRLNAFASLKGSKITLDLAHEVLHNLFQSKNQSAGNHSRSLTIESIQKAVADYYQIRLEDLKSQSRQKGVVLPRQIAMYLCKKHLRASFPEIGSKFGGKDHTTVIHAFRKIKTQMEQDPSLQNDLSILEKTILH